MEETPAEHRAFYVHQNGVWVLDEQPVEGNFCTQGVELARVSLDSDTVPINRRRLRSASAWREVYERVGGGGFAEQRGVGEWGELEPGVGE